MIPIFTKGNGPSLITPKKVNGTIKLAILSFIPVAKVKEKDFIINSLPIGAPAAVMYMESLISAKVKNFIFIGPAGLLNKNFQKKDAFIIDQAFRNEGTSYHYQPPSEFMSSDPILTSKLEQILKLKKQTTISTDAPFRETATEILSCQKRGISCIDMELAALYSVAKFYNVRASGILVMSDNFDGKKIISVKSTISNIINTIRKNYVSFINY